MLFLCLPGISERVMTFMATLRGGIDNSHLWGRLERGGWGDNNNDCGRGGHAIIIGGVVSHLHRAALATLRGIEGGGGTATTIARGGFESSSSSSGRGKCLGERQEGGPRRQR